MPPPIKKMFQTKRNFTPFPTTSIQIYRGTEIAAIERKIILWLCNLQSAYASRQTPETTAGNTNKIKTLDLLLASKMFIILASRF